METPVQRGHVPAVLRRLEHGSTGGRADCPRRCRLSPGSAHSSYPISLCVALAHYLKLPSWPDVPAVGATSSYRAVLRPGRAERANDGEVTRRIDVLTDRTPPESPGLACGGRHGAP